MTDRLDVMLADGSFVKFLWLSDDSAYGVLRQVLEEWLGERLTLK